MSLIILGGGNNFGQLIESIHEPITNLGQLEPKDQAVFRAGGPLLFPDTAPFDDEILQAAQDFLATLGNIGIRILILILRQK